MFFYDLQSHIVAAEPPALLCTIVLVFGGGIGSSTYAEKSMSAVFAFADGR
jgi:hypothetical protein